MVWNANTLDTHILLSYRKIARQNCYTVNHESGEVFRTSVTPGPHMNTRVDAPHLRLYGGWAATVRSLIKCVTHSYTSLRSVGGLRPQVLALARLAKSDQFAGQKSQTLEQADHPRSIETNPRSLITPLRRNISPGQAVTIEMRKLLTKTRLNK